jgi:PAS domain S-box
MPHLPFTTDTVLESLPDAFQAFDREWRYVYLNRQAERVLGRSRDELLGKVCWEVFPETAGTPFHARHKEAMESGETVVFPEWYPREKVWREFTLHPYPGGLGAFVRDITDRKRAEAAVADSARHYRALFENVMDAIVVADNRGAYVDANPAACDLFGVPREQLIGRHVIDFAAPGTGPQAKEAWRSFLETGEQAGEFYLRSPLDGRQRLLEYHARANVLPGLHMSVLRDITARREETTRAAHLMADLDEERETLDTVNRIGRLLSAELDLKTVVEAATDAATELTGAQFGAFFYNVLNDQGESYTLYTISGVPREEFSRFPMPRATPLFGPTFRGEGIIRIGDVKSDPRYGKMAPHYGMPAGHLPVRSYMAVPVISRSGEVLGGLFFGHSEVDVFTARAERCLEALTAYIAVAVDNARLFGRVQREAEVRRRTEEALRGSEEFQRRLIESSSDCIKTLSLDGKLLTMSEAGQRTFEIDDFAQVEGADYTLFWQGEERTAAARAVAAARAGQTGRFQGYCPTVGGTPKWWDVVVSPVLGASGLPEVLLAVSRDITEQKEGERRQRRFVREMLFGMTEGRLRLCDDPADLPEPLAPAGGEPIELTASTLRMLRKQVEGVAEQIGLPKERTQDLLTGVGEAAMNAVVHAGGGVGNVRASAQTVQVWVRDAGKGITQDVLHRATLERGWTTAGTLGHGFWLMLRTCDRAYMLTGAEGTTVVLEQDLTPPEPPWL